MAIQLAGHKFRFDIIIDKKDKFYLEFLPYGTIDDEQKAGQLLEKFLKGKLKLNKIFYRPGYRAAGLCFEIRSVALKDLFKRMLNL